MRQQHRGSESHKSFSVWFKFSILGAYASSHEGLPTRERVLEATSNQGLIKLSNPGGRSSSKQAACNIGSCISIDCVKMPVNISATAHVSQHISGISPLVVRHRKSIRIGLQFKIYSSREPLRLPSMASPGMRLHVKHWTSIWEQN